jgi:hypothetical protein
LTVPSVHAVGDVYATVGQPAAGFDTRVDVFQNGSALCTLTIPAGSSISSVVAGSTLAYLQKSSLITTAVTTTVQASYAGTAVPARDLTVTIRV